MSTIDELVRELIQAHAPQPNVELVDRFERAVARLEAAVDRLQGDASAIPVGATERPVAEIERRRTAHRPADVRLLVFCSPMPHRDPPDLTDFYLASGHLYRSIRAAFVVMEGERAVPTGEAFLHYFMERGCWLVAMPSDGRRERGRPSNRVRAAPKEFVRRVIAAAEPDNIIAITPRVSRLVTEVLRANGSRARGYEAVTVPKDLWQKPFIPRLRAMVGEAPAGAAGPPATDRDSDGPGPEVSLAEIAAILTRHGNKRMRVYQLADELAARASAPDVPEIRSAIRRILKHNREAFDQNGAGIRLAAEEPAPVSSRR
jgi:hypothetical protein